MLLKNSEQNRLSYRNKAIYTGQLAIKEFAKEASDKMFSEYFQTHTLQIKYRTIDLQIIKDLFLRRRIVNFLYSCMDSNVMLPYSFKEYRYLTLDTMLNTAPEVFSLPYNEFLQLSESIFDSFVSYRRESKSFFRSFIKYCKNVDINNNPFDGNIWNLSRFNLSDERNYASRFKTLSFDKINDDRNRFLVKKYIEYCLTNTDISVSTINCRIGTYNVILNMIDKPFDEWEDCDADICTEKITKYYGNNRTIASRIINMNLLAEYLLVHDYLRDNPLKRYKSLSQTGNYNYKVTSADNYVITQIFNDFNGLKDERCAITFLLIFCTGMRLSEALAISADCLEKRDTGTFVKFYSLKMKKDAYNIIPESLYERIDKYRKSRAGSQYLFPSLRPNVPMSQCVFYDRMNEFILNSNITNSDGTPYHFTAHSFRHLMAVRMREKDIPLQFIQEQLHHNSADMTLAYIEYIDKERIKKINKFIDGKAEIKEHNISNDFDSDEAYLRYLRNNMNVQMLPNGICARPAILGKCQYLNTCLSCPEYRTSCKDLPVHREHLNRTKQYIKIAEANGWLPQIESNKLIQAQLEQIISKLEEMETEDEK